ISFRMMGPADGNSDDVDETLSITGKEQNAGFAATDLPFARLPPDLREGDAVTCDDDDDEPRGETWAAASLFATWPSPPLPPISPSSDDPASPPDDDDA